MKEMLQVRDLKKYYKTPGGLLHAVDGISFSVGRGETLGVVGESGCGKSTLGRVLLNLVEATGGQVLFEGNSVLGAKGKRLAELRRAMQIIFQDPFSSLNPRMSVSELIGEPLLLHRIPQSKQQYRQRVAQLMETVGLAPRLAGAYPHELDGGRRQRVGIARALSLEPRFIVCDEPVSALDVSIQAQILNLMQDLQQEQGLTYLFITHDLSVVRHISDSILVMYLGVMVEKCESKALFRQPLHPYTQALLSAIPLPSSGARERKRQRVLLRGELTSPINPGPGCRFAPRCPHTKAVCTQEQPEWREVLPGHHVACHLAGEGSPPQPGPPL